jgi:hypothetical protein
MNSSRTLKIICAVTVIIINLLIFIGYVAFTRTHQLSLKVLLLFKIELIPWQNQNPKNHSKGL